jgi:uncharacterized membrane protein
MIVINRNGQRTVITGWREWAVMLPAMFLIAVLILALFFFLLSVAFTVMTLLLIGVPIAVILVLIVQLFQRQKPAPPG